MISKIQSYIENTYSEITYGQIQDTPDSLINLNIIDTGRRPFFKDDACHILSISLFVRENSFESMQNKIGEVSEYLLNLYDINATNIRIVNTNQVGGDDPYRDDKNRYYQMKTYEMIVENKKEEEDNNGII